MKGLSISIILKFIALIVFIYIAYEATAIANNYVLSKAIADCRDISRFKKIDKASQSNVTYEVYYPESETYSDCINKAEQLFK